MGSQVASLMLNKEFYYPPLIFHELIFPGLVLQSLLGLVSEHKGWESGGRVCSCWNLPCAEGPVGLFLLGKSRVGVPCRTGSGGAEGLRPLPLGRLRKRLSFPSGTSPRLVGACAA